MSLQFRGVDAVREGQFEARERLLQDMETQAREKTEAAEIENFKVKGLLSHMDQVVGNLRSQGGEERERLRLEHRRLEAMQASLDSERRVMHERFTAEMDQLKRKLAAAEEATQLDQATRREQQAEVAEQRRKLESDQKEFAVYVTTNVKAADRSAQQLKEEEARVLALRADVAQQQSALQQQKHDAADQLDRAAGWRQSIEHSQRELQLEREGLEDLARELQAMSDILVEKDNKFAMREQDIHSREQSLLTEKETIDAAYGVLQSKEKEVAQFHVHADQQRLAMQVLEATQRLQLALGTLQGGSSGSSGSGREKENVMQASLRASSGVGAAGAGAGGGGGARGGGQLEAAKGHRSPLHVGSRGSGNGSGTRGQVNFEKEIASAQQTMQMARGGVAKIAQTNNQRHNFLRNENDFLSKIHPNNRRI